MAQQTIGIGSVANDGTGDQLRTAFGKVNANEAELYASVAHPGVRNAFTSYYLPFGATPQASTAAVTANTLFYMPFLLPGAVVDHIGIEITTAAGTNCRLGIYTNSGGMPNSLIVDAGAVSTASIAIVEAAFASTTLPYAWVWVAALFDGAPTCRICTNSNAAFVGSGSLSTSARGLQVAQTYGALPSTATAPSAFSTAAPTIVLRKA